MNPSSKNRMRAVNAGPATAETLPAREKSPKELCWATKSGRTTSARIVPQ